MKGGTLSWSGHEIYYKGSYMHTAVAKAAFRRAGRFWVRTKVSDMKAQRCPRVLLTSPKVDMVFFCSKQPWVPRELELRCWEALAAAAPLALVMAPILCIVVDIASPEV